MAVLYDNTSRIQGLLNDINRLPVDGSDEAYERGISEGYAKGHADGLAARTYETWTITLEDGTVVEKEVALL